MRHICKRASKTAKRIFFVLLLFAITVTATSCGSKWDSFMASIGFDTKDYDSEKVIKSYSVDGELAAELSASVRMLTLNTPVIEEFRGSSEAISLFRDCVLNYMLITNYSRYIGDIETLDEAAEAYPYMKVTNIIPASEFEQTYYRFFGGSTKISNRSGEYFIYLPKIEAYTAISEPQTADIKVTVLSLEETQNTYRMCVTLTLGDNTSPAYNLLLIKRDDGTFYFKSCARA